MGNDPTTIGPNPKRTPGIDTPNFVAGCILFSGFIIGMLVLGFYIWKWAIDAGFDMPVTGGKEITWLAFLLGNVAVVSFTAVVGFFLYVIVVSRFTTVDTGPNGVCLTTFGKPEVFLWKDIVRVEAIYVRVKGAAGLIANSNRPDNYRVFRQDGNHCQLTAEFEETLRRCVGDVPWTKKVEPG